MTFLDAIRSGRTLLMDGAMGTELIRRGYTGPTWRANLDAPELVQAIHADYVAAGAEIVVTNTFLLPSASGDRGSIAAAAINAARSAKPAWTLGGLGPGGVDDAVACAELLHDTDAILLETWSDSTAFHAASAIRKRLPTMPVIVSFSFAPNEDAKARELAEQANREDIAAVGVNCGREQAPAGIAETLRIFRNATKMPLLARPNAGTPTRFEDQWIYPRTPIDWAIEALRISEVSMVGGCCGTTPGHIGELARLLRRKTKSPA